MATKKLVLITLLENKEWVMEKAEEYGVTIHRYYDTVGRSSLGDFDAIAFVISGEKCGDLIVELNDPDEFGL